MSIETGTASTIRKRPKDRRDQILRQAFLLISQSGFNSVSLADIAEACGIQKSSVLHHFGSMNELLLEVLGLRELEDYAFFESLPHPDTISDPKAARELLTELFIHNLDRKGFSRLYSMLSAESLAIDHPAHTYFNTRAKAARAEMAKILSWKPDPEIAATELLAFWSGIELAAQHDPDLDAAKVWKSFAERFFTEQDSAKRRK